MAAPTTDTGSFRDPSGFVFYYNGEVYRLVDQRTWDVVTELKTKGILDDLARRGQLVGTELVMEGTVLQRQLCDHIRQTGRFLHHERIPTISYPYEWSVTMLADAAALQLELQIYLLERGYSLKDASVFNIQFRSGQPIFIDVPSIEVPPRRDVWMAYGQFCRLFLFPLLLKRYRHADMRGYFLGNVDGLDAAAVYAMFGRLASLRPALLVDVFLQKHLHSYGTSHLEAAQKRTHTPSRRAGDAAAQVLNLQRLLRKVRRLAHPSTPTGPWADYVNTHSYSSEAETEKVNFIKAFLAESKPQNILDLGCNTGIYSMLAADAGARTTSVDSDEECVDALYRKTRDKKAAILPIWMDIANPSPGLGFCNRERKRFLDRVEADGVLALALIHHLLVSSRIPLESVCELFAGLTSRWLVVEYVDPQDSMFRRLLALREDIYTHLNQKLFEEVFGRRFRLVRALPLTNTKRVLYLYEKTDGRVVSSTN